MRDFTLRAAALGAVLTVLFTTANVYLGLKVGLTFATSIPAAVISMAVLRLVGNSNIFENNIVQTIVSAAGTLAAIIFVLPGLVMIGWWHGFPYWMTAAVCAIGGTLGVMFSIPLRRALVTGSDLPYPEGVAAAEVLKVGAGSREGAQENARGLRVILWSSVASAGFAALAATKLVTSHVAIRFKVGTAATGLSASFSMALIGIGHLVGLSVGVAMLLGTVFCWAVLIPWLTADAAGSATEVVASAFGREVRFVGAGTIGVAALWTLVKIVGPIAGGIRSSLAAARARRGGETLDVTERDMPMSIVVGTILLSLVPIGALLWWFAAGGPVAAHPGAVIGGSLLYVLVAGAIVAAVCGYMAGLIGASNSPISGVGILAVLGAAALLALYFGRVGDPATTRALVAYALFTTAVVFAIATISNDNLQDLKTGQLLGATPWRQQAALILGVVFGALTIPLVLDLLNTAFGFAGAPGAGPQALVAPQASLISALATGVLGGALDWKLIGIGAGIGVVLIAVDEALAGAGRMRLPPLGVGMGIYLPMSMTLLIPIGALIGLAYERWAAGQSSPEFARRMGVLAATGLIVGESLFGVVFAGIVGVTSNDTPLRLVGESFGPVAMVAAPVVFFAVIARLYAYARRASATMPAPIDATGRRS